MRLVYGSDSTLTLTSKKDVTDKILASERYTSLILSNPNVSPIPNQVEVRTN